MRSQHLCLADWKLATLPFVKFCDFVFYRKDVRLPVQLQRAMAAEAEAAREARAKVSNDWSIVTLLSLSRFVW